jgi:uncharacterized damage-inducible protein DinB
MTTSFPSLAITRYWAPLNGQLIGLIDLIPDDRIDWSPKPELHNFKGILIHISMSRHGWLANAINDGEPSPDVLRGGQTKEGLREQLRLSWARMERFLSAEEKLSKRYEGKHPDGVPYSFLGHWVAYHLLEHDIHHRADIFHYLALLGIEHGEIQAP